MTTNKAGALTFVKPDENMKDVALSFRDAFYAAGERVINGSGGLDFYPDFETWLGYLRRVERGEEEGFVPSRIWFAVQNSEIVGVLDIRPALPPEKATFGHIGYAVRPDSRGQGVAGAMCAWGVAELRRQGVSDILAACYDGNGASRRVLEACGFALAGTELEEQTGKRVLNFINKLKD